MRWFAIVLACWGMVVAGCGSVQEDVEPGWQLDTEVRMVADNGKYHEAARELPKAMAGWEELTGRVVEADSLSEERNL